MCAVAGGDRRDRGRRRDRGGGRWTSRARCAGCAPLRWRWTGGRPAGSPKIRTGSWASRRLRTTPAFVPDDETLRLARCDGQCHRPSSGTDLLCSGGTTARDRRAYRARRPGAGRRQVAAEADEPEHDRVGDPALDAAVAERCQRAGVAQHAIREERAERDDTEGSRDVAERGARHPRGHEAADAPGDEGQQREEGVGRPRVAREEAHAGRPHPQEPQRDRQRAAAEAALHEPRRDEDQQPAAEHDEVEDRGRGLQDKALRRPRPPEVADLVAARRVRRGVERLGRDDPHQDDGPGQEQEDAREAGGGRGRGRESGHRLAGSGSGFRGQRGGSHRRGPGAGRRGPGGRT